MVKKILFLLAVLTIISSAVVFADVTAADIQKAFPKTFTHPYLYFSDSDKPAMLEKIKTDPESRYIMERYIAEANRLLATPVDPQAPVEGKNTRYDTKDDYLTYYRSYLSNAEQLAFVYQMTGDKKYAEKAFQFADAVCDLQTWTIRAHEFPIIYTRVWPWNDKDDQVCFSFDHVNGDTARDMAAIYDWLYPALTKAQRDRIRGAIIEKAITRVRGNYEYHWWAASYRCNWCGVCNSGLGCAALALMTENPEFVDVVAESYNRINGLLDQLGENGGWQEGCGYWYYGVGTSVVFADALERTTGGKFNIFKHPKLAKNPVNFPFYTNIPTRGSIDFEDSGGGKVGTSYFYNLIAAETGSSEAVWYRNNVFGDATDMFDLIWPRSTIKPSVPDQASIWFKTIDWAILRSDFTDTEKVLVACKAGYNDDPHHGHLDCGHFLVYLHGKQYISEPGHSAYDEKYFDEARYNYPQASSIGHNLVFVNGEKQIIAKLKDQPWKENIGGENPRFQNRKGQGLCLYGSHTCLSGQRS